MSSAGSSCPGGGCASAEAPCAGWQGRPRHLAGAAAAFAGPATWINVSEGGHTYKGNRSENLAAAGTCRTTASGVGALTRSRSTCDAVGDKKVVANS